MKRLSVLAVVGILAGLFAIGVEPSAALTANNPYCTATHNGGTFNQVIVPSGAQCVLNGVVVNGAVYAYPDSSLIVCNSRLLGGLRGTRAYINIDNASYVAGSIDIQPPAGTIQYTGVTQTGCGQSECEYEYECEEFNSSFYESSNSAGSICPYKVMGGINIHNGGPNSNPFLIGDCGHMYIRDGVSIVYNQLPVYVGNATIKGDLRCYYNNPPAQASNVQVYGRRFGEGCVAPVESG